MIACFIASWITVSAKSSYNPFMLLALQMRPANRCRGTSCRVWSSCWHPHIHPRSWHGGCSIWKVPIRQSCNIWNKIICSIPLNSSVLSSWVFCVSCYLRHWCSTQFINAEALGNSKVVVMGIGEMHSRRQIKCCLSSNLHDLPWSLLTNLHMTVFLSACSTCSRDCLLWLDALHILQASGRWCKHWEDDARIVWLCGWQFASSGGESLQCLMSQVDNRPPQRPLSLDLLWSVSSESEFLIPNVNETQGNWVWCSDYHRALGLHLGNKTDLYWGLRLEHEESM